MRRTQPCIAGFEAGGRVPRPRHVGRRRGGNGLCPGATRRDAPRRHRGPQSCDFQPPEPQDDKWVVFATGHGNSSQQQQKTYTWCYKSAVTWAAGARSCRGLREAGGVQSGLPCRPEGGGGAFAVIVAIRTNTTRFPLPVRVRVGGTVWQQAHSHRVSGVHGRQPLCQTWPRGHRQRLRHAILEVNGEGSSF